MTRLSTVAAIAFTSMSVVTSASAQEFSVIRVHLDQTMAAKSITQAAIECTQNNICKTVLDAAAAYMGVDSSLITSAIAIISQNRAGEEGHYDYRLPSGYQYCRSTIAPISVNPASGDRASVLGATVYKQGLGVYS